MARAVLMVEATSPVYQIVYSWLDRRYGPQATVIERDFASHVSPEALSSALATIGRRLDTDSVDWPGYAAPRIVRALIREFDGEYVALLRWGSLDRIVNRRALAVEIAAAVA